MKKLCKIASLFIALQLFCVGAAQAADLTISAAASLTNAFKEAATTFEAKNPGTKITTNFAASNPLLKQIQEGAPVDIFATADQETMDKAEKGGLLADGTRKNFTANDLVLIAPGADTPAFTDAKGLTAKKVERIAIGNPDSVPAGRYAKQALTDLKLWEALQPKYIMGESVRQVLDYVSRGEVQAGFVYKSDAVHAGEKVKIVGTMQTKTPVTYPIAVIKTSKSQPEAKAFIEFITGKEGAAILAKYGFSAI